PIPFSNLFYRNTKRYHHRNAWTHSTFNTSHLLISLRLYILVIFVTVFNGRQTDNSLKYVTEGLGVSIAYIEHHFRNIFTGGFKSAFGGFYLYALVIFDNSVASGQFKTTFKTPATHSHHFGQLIHG